MSDAGRRLLASYEGRGANPYLDSKGYNTIGIGHLLDTNRDHQTSKAEWAAYDALGFPRSNLTEQQQQDLYAHDLQPRVDQVNGMLKGPVTQPMFDALVSMTFNIGAGSPNDPNRKGLLYSPMLKDANEGRFDDMPAHFLQYVHSGGEYLKGLENRRLKEVTGFATPYEREEGH